MIGIIFGLIIVIIILGIFLVTQRMKNKRIREQAQSDISTIRAACENEKHFLARRHEEEIASIRQECKMQIQQVREEVENRKEILLQMEEKELLVNVMVALDGYGSRIGRIERHLTDAQIIEQVTCLVQDILTKISDVTRNLSSQIDAMNSSIESNLNDSDLKRSIDTINTGLFDISADVEEIKTSVCDRYSWNSLVSNIDSIRLVVDEIKDVAESARYAAENAYSAAESAKDAVESHY